MEKYVMQKIYYKETPQPLFASTPTFCYSYPQNNTEKRKHK
jgi:hypothetical protein